MKAFAIQTIQRGKDANPRVIPAGKVFEATDAELLHLTPQGAVRKPTNAEIALAKWEEAESDIASAARAAVAAVEAEFGRGPAVVKTDKPVKTEKPSKASGASVSSAVTPPASTEAPAATTETTAAAGGAVTGDDLTV
ncbi:MAG: hypothetical protein P4M09_21980 [Devosia sp.]|nr:hypothetical protein [Devosia sp.]